MQPVVISARHSSTANAGFSGAGGTGLSNYDPTASSSAVNDAEGANPGLLNDGPAGTYEVTGDATGMSTSSAEALDDSAAGTAFREMGFSIEKVTVTAKSRALKAEYGLSGTRPEGSSWSGCRIRSEQHPQH